MPQTLSEKPRPFKIYSLGAAECHNIELEAVKTEDEPARRLFCAGDILIGHMANVRNKFTWKTVPTMLQAAPVTKSPKISPRKNGIAAR